MLERNNVKHPLWRKKVDATFLKDGTTPIPNWLHDSWKIKDIFKDVTSKSDKNSHVLIFFDGKKYSGQVIKHKAPNNTFRYRLFFEPDLTALMCDEFLMSYMRMLESELRSDSNHRAIEKEISFWEFIDIEFDAKKRLFYFTVQFKLTPQFPNLFSRLVGSAPIKRINDVVSGKESLKIYKQDWKPREEYLSEIGAENVIYMLLDSRKKLLYVGEAKKLAPRFKAGHPDINNWDYYKYNVLPDDLAKFRLSIERMVIRDLASLMANKQNIHSINISEYKLANRKIDTK